MDGTMSTTKEKEVIWDENHSTEPTQKSESNGGFEGCVITTAISGSNESVPSTATTKISGIYKIVNKVNGKYYVGSSKDIICYRWPQHTRALRANRHKNDYLQNAWNKYGENNFEIIVIKQVPPNLLLEIEQSYLDIAKHEQHKCYNLKFKSEGGCLSDYSLKKIGDVHRGIPLPIATKKKISDSTKRTMNTASMFQRMSISRQDKTIYKFINILTSDTFQGTRKEFCERFNFNKVIPYSLISGRRLKHKGWILDVNNGAIQKR